MSDDAVLAVIDALEALKIDYMVVGSFSSNFYGVPRSTKDADFVVQFQKSTVSELAAKLAPGFKLDRQPSFETVTLTTKYVLRRVDTPFYVEIFALSSDPYDLERYARRRVVSTLGRSVFLPSVEDVIITKLRWKHDLYRPKDVDDIRNVIAVQRANIDWDYVHHWCAQHGTRTLLDEIVESISKI
jgi:hypothetical protein